MNWLIFVAVTLLTDSFRIFLDNYTSDVYFRGRGAASQKIFHGVLQIAAALIILPFAGINFVNADWASIGIFFASGFIISLAGIPYYKALELDDSTNLGIFMQLSPVLYLILGFIFLGDTITIPQLIAFVVILAAPILILRTTNKNSQKVKLRAIAFAFIYVLITVISNLLFVKETGDNNLNFIAEIALFFLGKGVSSLIFVGSRKKWRHRFRFVLSRNPRKLPRLLFTNVTLGMISDATYRMALAAAPTVAIASAASDSVEPIVIFFMGLILTYINPRFGRENLTKKSVMVHLGATILVVIGVTLIQF